MAVAATSKVLVAGQVLDAVGPESRARAIAAAEVVVWWIPGLATSRVGDELDIETLATTATAEDGSYTISLALTLR